MQGVFLCENDPDERLVLLHPARDQAEQQLPRFHPVVDLARLVGHHVQLGLHLLPGLSDDVLALLGLLGLVADALDE